MLQPDQQHTDPDISQMQDDAQAADHRGIPQKTGIKGPQHGADDGGGQRDLHQQRRHRPRSRGGQHLGLHRQKAHPDQQKQPHQIGE